VYVVHAPPGYGKSTLIAQLAAADPRPVAWLTLDERDADPVTCFSDLVFALSDLDDGAVDLLGRLASGPAAVPTALPRLTRLLADHWQDALIVVDDVHHATGEAGDVIGALVSAVPEGSTLVLAGRVRPSLPIARLTADGHMATIDARALRMTAGEGRTMLSRRGATVDDQEAQLLVHRTEGWAAALYLVSHAIREDDGAGDVAVPQEAELIDYFRDEVLRAADPDDARFLLESSILEELSPGECDAILGRGDSVERLESLAAVDLFVSPVDARQTTYRMHGLFREALYERLRGVDPARAIELHRRAADHFAQQRDIEEAVRHALAAGDGEAAATLVWAATPEYEGNGRTATMERWLSLFSAEQFAAYPMLALTAAWIGIDHGDGVSAEHWTTVALNAPADLILPGGETMGASARLLEAALGKRGVVAMRDSAVAADNGFPEANPLKAIARYLRGAAAYAMDDLDSARGLLGDAQARAAGQLVSAYWLALAQFALIAIDEGDWDAAEAYIERAALTDRAALQDYTVQSLRFAVDALIGAHRGREGAARNAAASAKQALAAHRHYAPWFAAQTRKVLAAAFIELEWPAEARKMVAEARKLIANDADAVRYHRRLDELAAEVARGNGSITGGEALSTAELRTLQYLQTHLTQQEIAERLHLTRNTIHTHATAIYRKLGVTSRSEAVKAGHRHGLLDD